MESAGLVPRGLGEHLEREGWTPRELPGFIGLAGPLWTRKTGDGWCYGFLAGAQHLNPAGVVHGGALVTWVDHAMSTVAWEACERQPCVTVDLHTQFMAPVQAGDWVQVRTTVEHRAARLLFVRASLVVGDRVVLAAQGLLAVVGRP
jgi:uncharacterized protein (TIGR00369 family)